MDTAAAETLHRDLGFVCEQVQEAKSHLKYGTPAWRAASEDIALRSSDGLLGRTPYALVDVVRGQVPTNLKNPYTDSQKGPKSSITSVWPTTSHTSASRSM